MPVAALGLDAIRMRTEPSFSRLLNAFFASFSVWSWMNWISSSGIPLATSLSFMSW